MTVRKRKDIRHGGPGLRLAFWVALLAIPVVFFALVEGGLRLAGYGDDARLFVEVEHNGVAYYAIDPGVVRRYFGDPDFGTYVSRDRFRVEKQPDTYRIFALGASTTVGFPYLFHGSFPSLLRDRLVTQFPERRVEMVNVGITAVNSYAVADIARELMRYEPDLLLVYSGHNEFYGALGAASSETLGGRRWIVRSYLTLRRSRIVQLLRDVLTGIGRTASGPADSSEGVQLMERMARDQRIQYEGTLYRRVHEAYRANIDEVVSRAQRNGVDVVLATLASNEGSQPPFVSVRGEDGSESDARAFDEAIERAESAAQHGDCHGALQEVEAAIALDAHHARAHYLRGRCLRAAGRATEARDAFRRARDLDGLRFRASSGLNEAIREIANRRGVPLADVEATFASASPDEIIGEELMTEHVHPNLDGYWLMAGAFADAMAVHGLFASSDEWAAAATSPDEDWRAIAGLTEFDHVVADLRVRQLTSRWPFTDEPAPFTFSPQSLAERSAWDYLNGRMAWGASRNELSRAYAEAGDMARSADEFWALAKVVTYDPHYALLAADMHARDGRFESAARMLAWALSVERQPMTYARLGGAIVELGREEEGLAYLQRALALSEGRPLTPQQRAQIHLFQARAFGRLGDETAAREQIERARALGPVQAANNSSNASP